MNKKKLIGNFFLLMTALIWGLAFVAFVGVLVLAVALEREVRLVARERLGTLPISVWLGAARRRPDE